MTPIRQIRKRDGRLVPFERAKIADAIFRAAQVVGGEDRFLAEQLAGVVGARVAKRVDGVPTIEDVQDAVEKVLIEAGHAQTAKQYILYRERRRQVRDARARAEAPETQSLLVGGDRGPFVDSPWGRAFAPQDEAAPPETSDAEESRGAADFERPVWRFSKARVADAIIEADGIPRAEAEEVARAVEARLLRGGTARVSEDMLTTLVRAELFDRGRVSRLEAPRRQRLPTADLERLLRGRAEGRRAANPAVLTEAAGEALIGRHLLEHGMPAAVADASRVGDLHVYDLGSPFRLPAIALDAVHAAAPRIGGEHFTLKSAPRRALAALEHVILENAHHAGRVLALENVNVFLAPFLGALDADALGEMVRGFLLSPALTSLADRGGLLRVELGLAVEAPARVQGIEVPAPGLPGRRYGDDPDAALRVLRVLLQEATALRRHGHWCDAAFTLLLPRGQAPWDATQRALLRDAVRSASECGEPRFLFEDPAAPTRGSRWLRRAESEVPDPLRFDTGDVTVAGCVALNLVAAALRVREAGVDAFERECERLLELALDAAAIRRDLLEALGTEPGGALYPLRRGTHPLVDLEGAFHLFEWVGLDQALALLAPSGGGAAAREELRRTMVQRLDEALRRHAAPRRLVAVGVEEHAHEAAARFARIDAARYPETAGWWPEGTRPTYRRSAAGTSGVTREPTHPSTDQETGPGTWIRVRHRVATDARPAVDEMLAALNEAARDASVGEVAIDPWPRRTVHRTDPTASPHATS